MNRPLIAGLTLTAVAVLVGGAAATTLRPSSHETTTPAEQARISTDAFFERYVDRTGRVVRPDQGGDTVSEGQAYALLLAAASGNRQRFRLVWDWTRSNLQRDDRLFSWHWDGGVTDPQPATDADLDIARALVVAGNRFSDGRLRRAGIDVGRSILREETAPLDSQRVLLPGPWASHTPPLLVNPSYFSPAALQVLHRATGNAEWLAVERGTRRVVNQLSTGTLPPEWAVVSADGEAFPSPSPSGAPSTFGWEAARVPLRLAESCNSGDRGVAASLDGLMDGVPDPLGGSSLLWTARAASAAAAGRAGTAAAYLDEATAARIRFPTYYGDAWEALGRQQALDGRLGGCPGAAA
jgi:endoglucanase